MTTTALERHLADAVDSIPRRKFIGMMAAAGLFAACGNDNDSRSASAKGSDATRTVRGDNGTLEVPAEPERVVAAIGSFETDMVAVGVMPVLTTSFAGPWVEFDESVTITDNIPPTAEELARARPDLMVGWNWVTQEPSFDEIRKVAPYVGLGETAATAGPGFDGNQPMRSWDRLSLRSPTPSAGALAGRSSSPSSSSASTASPSAARATGRPVSPASSSARPGRSATAGRTRTPPS